MLESHSLRFPLLASSIGASSPSLLRSRPKLALLRWKPKLQRPTNGSPCVCTTHRGSVQRFVRPSKMSEQRIVEYIEGKYGKFGVDRVWHDTALPFEDVLQEFEEWVTTHHLWNKEEGGLLNRAAFVTCGNWDVKTKIPEQCRVSKIKLPSYFKEWINLKDIYLNFYNRRATGMMTMMRELQMPPRGSHHLGIDDSKNIARVLQRMLADGVLMQITARRNSSTPGEVKFLFKNRIR